MSLTTTRFSSWESELRDWNAKRAQVIAKLVTIRDKTCALAKGLDLLDEEALGAMLESVESTSSVRDGVLNILLNSAIPPGSAELLESAEGLLLLLQNISFSLSKKISF